MKNPLPFLLLGLSLLALSAPAQSEAADEAMDGLKKAFKEKYPDDQIAFAGKFVECWGDADDKQRAAIQKLCKRGLKSKDRDVRVAFVESVSKQTGGKKDKWGTKSTDLLAGILKQKSTEKDLDFMDKVVAGIGTLANKKGVGILTNLLKYKEYAIVAAAARALANYRDAPIKSKKLIFEEVNKIYGGLENSARDPRNATARRRLGVVQSSMELCLDTITGKKIDGAMNYQRWWNNEGKKAKSWGPADK